MYYVVRYGHHSKDNDVTTVVFDNWEDARHFATVMTQDEEQWVEFDPNPISQFASRIEEAVAE